MSIPSACSSRCWLPLLVLLAANVATAGEAWVETFSPLQLATAEQPDGWRQIPPGRLALTVGDGGLGLAAAPGEPAAATLARRVPVRPDAAWLVLHVPTVEPGPLAGLSVAVGAVLLGRCHQPGWLVVNLAERLPAETLAAGWIDLRLTVSGATATTAGPAAWLGRIALTDAPPAVVSLSDLDGDGVLTAGDHLVTDCRLPTAASRVAASLTVGQPARHWPTPDSRFDLTPADATGRAWHARLLLDRSAGPIEQAPGEATVSLWIDDRQQPLSAAVPLPLAVGRAAVLVAGLTELPGAPLLDGRIDDPAWEAAPLLAIDEGFTARLGWHEQSLYLAVRLAGEPGLPAVEREHDGRVDLDDGVTLRLAPSDGDWYELAFNRLGARRDLLVTRDGLARRVEWQADWLVATAGRDEGWSAEARLALADFTALLDGPPQRIDLLRQPGRFTADRPAGWLLHWPGETPPVQLGQPWLEAGEPPVLALPLASSTDLPAAPLTFGIGLNDQPTMTITAHPAETVLVPLPDLAGNGPHLVEVTTQVGGSPVRRAAVLTPQPAPAVIHWQPPVIDSQVSVAAVGDGVTAQVAPRLALAPGDSLAVEVSDDHGRALSGLSLAAGVTEFSLPASVIGRPGRYQLALTVWRGGEVANRTTAWLEVLASAPAQARVDAAGRLLSKHDQAVQPLGWVGLGGPETAHLDLVQIGPWPADPDATGWLIPSLDSVLARAQENRTGPAAQATLDALAQRVLGAVDDPRVLAWLVADRPELAPLHPAFVHSIRDHLRRLDPDRPLVIIHGDLAALDRYRQAADIVAIHVSAARSLGQPATTDTALAHVQAALERRAGVPLWLVADVRSPRDLTGRGDGRRPTTSELWQLLSDSRRAGASGVFLMDRAGLINDLDLRAAAPFVFEALAAVSLPNELPSDDLEAARQGLLLGPRSEGNLALGVPVRVVDGGSSKGVEYLTDGFGDGLGWLVADRRAAAVTLELRWPQRQTVARVRLQGALLPGAQISARDSEGQWQALGQVGQDNRAGWSPTETDALRLTFPPGPAGVLTEIAVFGP